MPRLLATKIKAHHPSASHAYLPPKEGAARITNLEVHAERAHRRDE
ncbi:MAG: hypothetical protein HW416_3716 [Chloroflexi bacterium]|nr:hypothetical protein [Chloroflexota bacterium]